MRESQGLYPIYAFPSEGLATMRGANADRVQSGDINSRLLQLEMGR